MWAQLITLRLKTGREEELHALLDQLRSVEQPGSGIVRQSAMRDQNDPRRFYLLALFESEERARERENDPRRTDELRALRATMVDIIEGTPEFIDLMVISEVSS